MYILRNISFHIILRYAWMNLIFFTMTALCRTIEIDLRDMLNESPLPEKVQPKDNILY